MKILLRVFLLLSATAAVFAADVASSFPTELRLTSGATLHKCQVVRWTSEAVVVKHAGGTDPIRFANIAPEQRAIVEQVRKADAAAQAAKSAVPTNAAKERIYKGQVFVVTQGGGNAKLGGLNVRAFPMSVLALFDGVNDRIALPTPLASTVTDADGRFVLSVPGSEPFFIFSQGSRFMGTRAYPNATERYDWRITSDSIKDPGNVLLTNRNMDPRNFSVTVEEN